MTRQICLGLVTLNQMNLTQFLAVETAAKSQFKRLICSVINFNKDAAWMQIIRECRSLLS
ncbi:MAG: hypothetical protein ACI9F1_002563 [Colwellia sp.]